MSEEIKRAWTEAPASVTIKFRLGGYDTMLTLRGEAGGDVLPKLGQALGWLETQGAVPTGYRPNGVPNGKTDGTVGGSAEAPMCPVHNRIMKQSQHGGWFCTAKIAEDDGTGKPAYCKQTAK